jgi:hypothetical protein
VTGFRLEQLASALTGCGIRDWKAPIRAVIPVADRPVVEKAVLWFTNTIPMFEAAPGATDQVVVTSLGYRLGRAGDPVAGSVFRDE